MCGSGSEEDTQTKRRRVLFFSVIWRLKDRSSFVYSPSILVSWSWRNMTSRVSSPRLGFVFFFLFCACILFFVTYFLFSPSGLKQNFSFTYAKKNERWIWLNILSSFRSFILKTSSANSQNSPRVPIKCKRWWLSCIIRGMAVSLTESLKGSLLLATLLGVVWSDWGRRLRLVRCLFRHPVVKPDWPH
jgi:hypothetical protein